MVSRIALVLISTYFLNNIIEIEKGVDLYLLACAFALVPLFWRHLLPRNSRPSIHPLLLLCVLFLGYAVMKMYVDELDAYSFFQNTLGTTGGLLFSFVTGVVVSAAFVGIEPVSVTPFESRRSVLVSGGLNFLWAGWVFGLSLYALHEHAKNLRSDILLVEGLAESYQRPGALAIMQGVMNLVMSNFVLAYKGHVPILPEFSWLLLVGSNVMLTIVCQMIGSNSGTVVLAASTFAHSLLHFLYSRPRWPGTPQTARTLGRLSRLRITILCMGAGLFALAALLFSESFDRYTRMLRVFGFSDDGVSSITSRLELLEKNLLPQLAFDPLFGHVRVELLTTGVGSYQHNALSIWTHLGFVAFVLYLILGLTALVSGWNRMHRTLVTGGPSKDAVTILILVVVIYVVASLFTFFTWMPLWFILGIASTWPTRRAVVASSSAPRRLSLAREY